MRGGPSGRNPDEFATLHVVTKNVQNLRDENRFNDFIAELDLDFSLLCLTETWRATKEECFTTPLGHRVFLSGGSDAGHQGVGIVVSRDLCRRISNVMFHAYSARICGLQFHIGSVKLKCFSVYMPATWESEEETDHCYGLLDVLLDECDTLNFITLVAGDFNANVGAPLAGDDLELIGSCGLGNRNDRGWTLARWVGRRGLTILNRMRGGHAAADSWTCCRAMVEHSCNSTSFLRAGRLSTLILGMIFACQVV